MKRAPENCDEVRLIRAHTRTAQATTAFCGGAVEADEDFILIGREGLAREALEAGAELGWAGVGRDEDTYSGHMHRYRPGLLSK